MGKKKITVFDNSLVDNIRRQNALDVAYVSPKFNVEEYSHEMENPQTTFPEPDSGGASWFDAFATWQANRNSVNKDNSIYKIIKDSEDYNTLVNAKQYLEDKDNFYKLIDEVKQDPNKYKELEPQINLYKDRVNKNTGDYIKSFQSIAKGVSNDTPTQMYTGNVGYVALPTNKIDYFSLKPQDQLNILNKNITDYEKLNEANMKDASEYQENYDYWNNKVSSYYKYRSSLPGMDLGDIDTYIYKVPGLMGSSAATLGATALGIAGSALMMVPEPTGLTKVAGAGLLVGSNVYSRDNESSTEAYGAYKDLVKQQADTQNISKSVLEDAKRTMKNSGKFTEQQIDNDDFVYDQILRGTLPSSNQKFRDIQHKALRNLSSVYKDNMALSTLDIAEDVLAVVPLGKIANAAKSILPKGLVNAATKTAKYTGGIKEQFAKRIEDAANYGLEGISKLPLKDARKKLVDLGGRIALTSVLEGAEEGTQYMISQEYKNNPEKQEKGLIERYVSNLGKGIRSVYAALTPFDPVYSDDQEFMENYKGGALLGGLMTGAIGGVTTGASIYDYTHNQFPTTSLLSNLYADKVSQEAEINKSLTYADYYRKGKWNRIENAFDELENSKINGLDSNDIHLEKVAANKFLNYFTSPQNILQAKALGIDTKSDDYALLTALKQHHYDQLNEANKNTAKFSGELALRLNDKDASDYISNLQAVKDGKVTEFEVQSAILNKLVLDKTQELANKFKDTKDAANEISNKLGIRTNKSDIISIANILKKFQKDDDKNTANKELNNKIKQAGITDDMLSIPTIHKDLSDLAENFVAAKIDQEKSKTEFDLISSFNKDHVMPKLDKFKSKQEKNSEFVQKLNDIYSGNAEQKEAEKAEEITVPPISEAEPVKQENAPEQPLNASESSQKIDDTNVQEQVLKPSTESQNKPETPSVAEKAEEQKPIEKEPEEISKIRKGLLDHQATFTDKKGKLDRNNPKVKLIRDIDTMLESHFRMVNPEDKNDTFKENYASILKNGFYSFKASGIMQDDERWSDLYDAKQKLEEALYANDNIDKAYADAVQAIDNYNKPEVSVKTQEETQAAIQEIAKDQKEQTIKQIQDQQEFVDNDQEEPIDEPDAFANPEYKEPQTLSDVLSGVLGNAYTEAVEEAPKKEIQPGQRVEIESPKTAENTGELQPLEYDRSVDVISHRLNYELTNSTRDANGLYIRTPKKYQGMEQYLNNEDFAKISANDDFIPEVTKNGVDIVVKPYTDTKGNVSDALYAIFKYKGKEYIAAISTVDGLQSRGNRAFQKLPYNNQQIVIQNLIALRTKVINLNKAIAGKNDYSIRPTIVRVTNGVYENEKNVDGSPKNKPLAQSAWLTEKDPYKITPQNTEIGISTGPKGGNQVRVNEMIVSTKGDGMGSVYLMTKKLRSDGSDGNISIKLNPLSFKNQPEVADFILDLLTNLNDNFTDKNGIRTPISNLNLLSLIANFGSHTAVNPEDQTLTKEQIDQRLKKQFYITEDNTLVLGNQIYSPEQLTKGTASREVIKQYITDNLHWNLDQYALQRNWFGGDSQSSVKQPGFEAMTSFFKNSNVDKVVAIPGILEFTQKDFGIESTENGKQISKTNPNGISLIGWYIKQNILQTDVADKLTNAAIYIDDVHIVDNRVEKVAQEAQNLANDVSTSTEEDFRSKVYDLPDENGGRRKINMADIYDILDGKNRKGKVDDGANMEIDVDNASTFTINPTDAKTWLKDKLGISPEITSSVIDITDAGNAVVGRVTKDSILLSEFAPVGTEYHEAWHRVSQLLISEKERNKIYYRYRRINNLDLSDKQIDEELAEDFREFMLYADSKKDSLFKYTFDTKNWFRRIYDFIRLWARTGSFGLAKIQYYTAAGRYRGIQPNAENVARFQKIYEKTGADMQVAGHDFKAITSWKQVNDITKSLMYAYFQTNFTKDSINYADLSKMSPSFDKLYTLLKNTAELQANAVMDEVVEKFNDVFVPLLRQQLKQLNIRTFDELNNDVTNIEAGSAKVNIGQHTTEGQNISLKDNAPAEVKFFMQTIPEYVFDKNGKPIVKLHPNTGFPSFVDANTTWSNVLKDLSGCRSLRNILSKIQLLSDNGNLFYTAILSKFTTLIQQSVGKDEKVAVNAEAMLSKLETVITSDVNNFITVKVEKDDNGLSSIRLIDNGVDFKAAKYPKIWSSALFTQSGIFQYSDDKIIAVPKAKEKLNVISSAMNNLIHTFTNNKGVFKLNDKSYDLHEKQNQERVKDYIVNIFNNLGILIDKDTINQMLLSGKYGDTKSDTYTLLNAFITSRVNFGGFSKLLSIVNTINKAIKDNGEVKDIDFGEGVVSPTDLLSKIGFIKTLANNYAYVHSTDNGLSTMGPDSNSYYKVSQNNFTKDRVNELLTNSNLRADLSKAVYNQGSLILKTLQQPNATLQVESFISFKDSTSFDVGRDYFNITDREDYLAKMSATQTDRLVFPTVADKKTYYFISGVKLPHERINFFTDEKGNTYTQYGEQTLDTLLGYVYDEKNRIELTLRQIDDNPDHLIDGIHYNEDGTINEDWLEPSKRIKNYHLSDKFKDSEGNTVKIEGNGTRFLSFNGIYTNKGFINFNDPKKSAKENLQTANDYFFGLPIEQQKQLLSGVINKLVRNEIEYSKKLGLITQYGTAIQSLRNELLDDSKIAELKTHYSNVSPESAEGYAVWDMLADYTVNNLISINEIEKIFSGDPAYYKVSYNENGMIDNAVDKIKRLGSLTSTGTNNRLDFFSDFINSEYTVSELNDYEVKSKQYDILENLFTRGNIKETIQEMRGDHAWDEVKDKTFDEIAEAYPEEVKMAQMAAKREVLGYKSGINVADAAVYISPNMFRNLMRMQGKWSPEIKNAFKILTDHSTADKWESDPKLYAQANKTILNALKYMAFGTRFRNGLAIPYFNKMALFPLFKSIATGDIKPLYDRMMQPGNELDMVMFNSAVKAGSEAPSDYYTNGQISDLNKLHTYKQNYKYLRQQLVTDPHTHEEQMAGTQFLKVNLSNLRMGAFYGKEGDQVSGESIKNSIMSDINKLSDIGKAKLQEQLLDEDGNVDINKLSKMLIDDAYESGADDNIISGLKTVNGKFVTPLAALSDNRWIESRFISMINKKVIDINMPGGSFIQRSIFGQEATQLNVITPSMIGDGRALKMINEEGSMDAIVSINLFKHIIPDYNKKTFTEAKQWLIDNNIIGQNANANAIGYRIPTQAIASISSLRFVDVLPEIMGDTIMLPEEFTKLTGSDFDVDKLYIARLQYRTKDGITSIVDDIEDEDGIRNDMLKNYLRILLTQENTNSLKLSIDVATDNVKAVLRDIESNRSQDNVQPFASYSPSFQEERKAEYTGGKAGIGPFALNNAHHILTQLTDLKMLRNDFTEALGIVDVGRIYDTPTEYQPKGGRILDWLSAMINGFVDIAKDPYIVRLNVNAWTYNMVSFLLRTGKGAQTFYFMSQPILKEMADAVLKTKGKYGIDRTKSPSQLERDAINSILEKYDPTGNLRKKYDYIIRDNKLASETYKHLFNVDKNGISYLRELIMNPENFANRNEEQVKIYYAWLAIKKYADSLANLVKYSKVDTKKTGKNFTEQRAYLNGMNNMLLDNNFESGSVKRFYNETFVQQKTTNSIPFGISIFKRLLLRNSDKFINKIDQMLQFMGRSSLGNSKLLSALTTALEASIKTEFFQNHAVKNNIDIQKMFVGERTVAKRLNNFKLKVNRGDFPDLLVNGKVQNDFLEMLLPNINSDYGLDFIDMSELLNQDQSQSNNLINYWRELINHPNERISNLFQDLATYAFFTSGDNSTMNGFFKYLPNDYRQKIGYVDYIQEQLNNLSDPNAYWDTNSEDLFLNNWYNDTLVRPVELNNSKNQPLKYLNLNNKSTIPNIVVGERVGKEIPAINPIAWVNTSEGTKPLFSPFIKIRDSFGFGVNNWHVFKLIGFKERAIDQKMSNYIPVYGLVEKKGYKYRGHTIVEYGKPTAFDFNKENVWDYDSAIDNPNALVDLADNYQRDQWEDLISDTGIQPINELASYREYLNNKDIYSPYEEDADDTNDTMDGYTSPLAEIDEPNTQSNNIEQFINIYAGTNENANLSNFAIRPFIIDGEDFQSVEQYFQYVKKDYVLDDITKEQFDHNHKVALQILNTTNGSELRRLGKSFQALDVSRWNRASSIEMKKAIKASFEDNPGSLQQLLNTGNSILTHNQDNSNWRTEFPRILMEVRNDLRTNNKIESIDEMINKPISTTNNENTNVIQSIDNLIEEGNMNTKQQFVNHSGGAKGSDSVWGQIGEKYGVISNHYYAEGEKTPSGNIALNKEQLSEADNHLIEANKRLNRKFPASSNYVNNLLRRNWYQVKNSDAVFAIGKLNDSTKSIVDGGTGWAVQMAIDNNKPVYLFNQLENKWMMWDSSSNRWLDTQTPTLTTNFAGIGTREITDAGIKAIEAVYKKTFSNTNTTTNENGLFIMGLYDKGVKQVREELKNMNLTAEQQLEYENSFTKELRDNDVNTEDKLSEQVRKFICNL